MANTHRRNEEVAQILELVQDVLLVASNGGRCSCCIQFILHLIGEGHPEQRQAFVDLNQTGGMYVEFMPRNYVVKPRAEEHVRKLLPYQVLRHLEIVP